MFAGLVVLPVAAWTIVTALYNDEYCWTVDKNNYMYIIDGPRIFTLVVSPCLMVKKNEKKRILYLHL
jgi:hypothetical protein